MHTPEKIPSVTHAPQEMMIANGNKPEIHAMRLPVNWIAEQSMQA